MSLDPDLIKRHTIMLFEYDGRQYRVISEMVSEQGDIKLFVEQKIVDNVDSKEKQVWVEVSPMLTDKNHMTIEQCTQVLKQISDYVNVNFFIV